MSNSDDTHIIWNENTKEYDVVDVLTGEVCESRALSANSQRFIFSPQLARIICEKIRSGCTIKDLHDDPTMPTSAVISHWRRNHPLFKEALELAVLDRGTYYHDSVMEIAKDLANSTDPTSQEVSAKKAALDAYKWGASKGNPDQYGDRSKVTHEGSAGPQQLVVFTGIDRSQKQMKDAQEAPAEVIEHTTEDTQES